MNATWKPAILIFLALTVLTGVVYPLVTMGITQLVMHGASNGSLIAQGDRTVGSRLVGQTFDDPKYLWGRPSATGPTSYNAASSSGSNLGPLNPALVTAVASRIETLRKADPGNTAVVPTDLVTASGSGLDPDILPDAAAYQVGRVARTRNLDNATVRSIVDGCTKGRQFVILGMPRVNVLCVNLALDAKTQ